MDFASIPIFSVMKSKLDYISQRQSLLAQNIANADTPGYKAKDVAKPDFEKMVNGSAQNLQSNLQMTVTNPKHMTSANGSGNFKEEKRKNTYELNPTGNNVVIEEEMAKIAENQAEYQKTTSLYHKMTGLFRTALGSSNTGG